MGRYVRHYGAKKASGCVSVCVRGRTVGLDGTPVVVCSGSLLGVCSARVGLVGVAPRAVFTLALYARRGRARLVHLRHADTQHAQNPSAHWHAQNPCRACVSPKG